MKPMIQPNDAIVPQLGDCKIPSPYLQNVTDPEALFVDEAQRVLKRVRFAKRAEKKICQDTTEAFELAGPRRNIFFDPSKMRCAIVTCGGLCPGLNALIRAIVLELTYGYGIKHIWGIRYGLRGFIPRYGYDFMNLSAEVVTDIMKQGGSILGSSRGPQDIGAIVDCLEQNHINALFMAGGDGTLAAAEAITNEVLSRNLKISIIGLPKTIDNDIHLVSRSFGFDTAVEMATKAIRAAHNEARGYPNGIGLIKLMGRYSGFIAAATVLAEQDANFVLIPEVDFDLEGKNALLEKLEKRLSERGHAVIVAAEGAGQKFFDADQTQDASGNVQLNDIGLYLKERIKTYFEAQNVDVTLKYIDPSYMIRSVPANANDQVFCNFLGRNAVHAAMAGKTGMLIGHWNNEFVHLPMRLSAGRRKKIDPLGRLWRNVLAATGQGSLMAATVVK
jgi:6-phosphofructokinase 1